MEIHASLDIYYIVRSSNDNLRNNMRKRCKNFKLSVVDWNIRLKCDGNFSLKKLALLGFQGHFQGVTTIFSWIPINSIEIFLLLFYMFQLISQNKLITNRISTICLVQWRHLMRRDENLKCQIQFFGCQAIVYKCFSIVSFLHAFFFERLSGINLFNFSCFIK